MLERLTTRRARVGQCVIDLVPEGLLEPARREALAAQLPVGLRFLGIGERPQALVCHQLVVQLAQSVLPRCVPLEALTGEVVVVDDQDVCMPVTSGGIRVHRDHVVGAVHAFREFDGHVPDALKVGLRGHVELVRVERQNVALKLVRSAMSSGVRLGTRYELRRCPPAVDHGHRIRGSACRSDLEELLSHLRVTPVEDVPHGSCSVGRGADVHGAHVRIRSPSEARTSSTAAITSRRRPPSTAAPLRSAWFRFTPTRRSCSTAGARDVGAASFTPALFSS